VLSQSKISLKQHLLTKVLLYRQQIHRHQPQQNKNKAQNEKGSAYSRALVTNYISNRSGTGTLKRTSPRRELGEKRIGIITSAHSAMGSAKQGRRQIY
jgi:hypothetical protein